MNDAALVPPMTDPAFVPPMTDVAFDLAASSLPAGCTWLLAQAIERRLPWIADEPRAGMHPLRATVTGYGVVLLAQRAKLVLRVPSPRTTDCLGLAGASIDIEGSTLRIGAGRLRVLMPSPTLAALRVASDAKDVRAFEAEARERLSALAVDCALIAGLRREEKISGGSIAGYALTLHDLSPTASLRIQGAGLGASRRLGWGVFVPAKAIHDVPAPPV